MKKMILLFAVLFSLIAYAQDEKKFTVSINKQSISALPSEDNSNKQLIVYATARSVDMLKIVNTTGQEEKNWKRSFEIFDPAGTSVLKIPASDNPVYLISVKQLRSSLKKGTVYSLYTMALPKNPELAATVRVRRILVCSINVK